MIEIGMMRPLPLAAICTSPTARGPLFLTLVREVCAGAPKKAMIQTAMMTGHRSLLYKKEVCLKMRSPESGELPMQVNDKAPQFNLPDQNGQEISLKDFHDKTVVLFFFPKADTPG